MRGTIILSLALSAFLCLGFTSCSSSPDVWECGHVWPLDQDGNPTVPIEQSGLYCRNYDTGETKHLPIQYLDRCIRNPDKRCKWVMTDIDERNRLSSCIKNPEQDMCK